MYFEKKVLKICFWAKKYTKNGGLVHKNYNKLFLSLITRGYMINSN